MRNLTPAFLFAATAFALAGCSDRRRPREQQQLVAFEVVADRLDGVPGTVFRLQSLLGDPTGDTSVTWTLDDMRSLAGSTIELSYHQPGIYQVTATASRPGRVATMQTIQLTVFDPTPGANLPGTDIAMPVLFGDVDADGNLTARDVHLVAKAAAGLEPVPMEQRRSADFDVNGVIDLRDAQLLARAVAAGGELPSDLRPSSGPRGSVLSLVSRHLLDLTAQVQVRIGSAPPRPVRRLHPGRATLLVPMDAIGSATIDPIAPGTIPIVLAVNGVNVERFEFALDNPPDVSGDEPRAFADTLAGLVALVEQAELAVARDFGSLGQSPLDRATLQSFLRFAIDGFRDASRRMADLVPELSTEEARALGYFLHVGGLRGLEAGAQAARNGGSIRSASGPGSGVDLLNLLCAVNDATDLAGRVDTALSTACGVAAIGAGLSGFLNGPIGPAVAAAILAICNGISVASDTLAVVTTILPKPASTLQVTAQRLGGASPPTFHIRVAAALEKDLLCGAPGSFLINRVRDLIVRRLSQRLTAWLSFGFIRNFPFLSRDGTLRQRIVDFMVGQIQSLAGVVVDAAGLQDWIERKKNEFCTGQFGAGQIGIPIDQLRSFGYAPEAAGTLNRPAVGTEPAVFVCAPPMQGNETVLIGATVSACGRLLAGTVTIDCRGVAVTFCQGDNGSALDDIFELVVDGEVVLAPSIPVRRVCAARTLAPGDHDVLLRGRAAPDNIGTYFLEASVGQLLGPPLSGTDLTAGRVFRWTLRLQPQQ